MKLLISEQNIFLFLLFLTFLKFTTMSIYMSS